MERLLQYKQNDLIKLEFEYFINKQRITESIYAEFISLNTHHYNKNYFISITVKQIVDIEDYLNHGSNHKLIERTILKHQLSSYYGVATFARPYKN